MGRGAPEGVRHLGAKPVVAVMPLVEWPRVDEFMSDEDLTAAAELLKSSMDWGRVPNLAALFRYSRPCTDRLWHELVAMTLCSLEKNGDALNKRNMVAYSKHDVLATQLLAARQLIEKVRETVSCLGASRPLTDEEMLDEIRMAVSCLPT